ncbi:MAG: MiaB/RimO family radical SAM methylthiotransferase [Oscillospiraceae bacterium]|nr:MiaB/RimO family radical SAM methylthiotransferase [Oscillospiraceae bacterium]
MTEQVKTQLEYMDKISKINKGKNLKYHIITMGCQLNENDSEKIAGMLMKMQYAETIDSHDANILIFNTCCVRENSEEKLFGKIGETKKLRKEKGTIVAICGCMMQEKHITEKIKKSYPFIDIIFGTHTLYKFAEDLYNLLQNKKKIVDVIDIDGEIYEGLPIKRNDNKKANVIIMYGCNNFCSYCIVPYVRGRERSRSPQDILNEVRELAKEGYKEITLLGQNVNSYAGKCRGELCSPEMPLREVFLPQANAVRPYTDNTSLRLRYSEYGNALDQTWDFAILLKEVAKIDGIETIRFLSPHPKDFTDEVIEAISENKKVSRWIHLPLQSGSTNVLKLMNRKYTKEQYLNLVEKIKNKIPDVVLSTDIIVGFPGETEEDFEDTLEVVKKVGFEQVYMFIYSKRIGTPAAEAQDQISEDIKHKRFDRLKKLVDAEVQKNNQKYIGKTEKILVEGFSKNNENMLTGRNSANKIIVFEGNSDLIGKTVEIKITSEHQWYLRGKVENNIERTSK